MTNLSKFLYDLLIGIISGIVSGLIVTWILKSELKLILPKEAIKRVFSKEILIGALLIFLLIGYFALVEKGILPKPEFDDPVIVYDLKGNEYVSDRKGTRPTGVKRDFEVERKQLLF